MKRLEQLLERHQLDQEQGIALASYVRAILEWKRANITGLESVDEVVDTLIADSLALLRLVPDSVAGREPEAGPACGCWLDLGSGAGIPGLPLAIAVSSVRMTLLESIGKKCAFLREAVAAAGVGDRVQIVCQRSERFAAQPPGREAYDLVLARAVGPLPTVAELAAPLLAVRGRLLVPTSADRAAAEREAGARAAERCGLALESVEPLDSPVPQSVCVVLVRTGKLPGWLPRREGRARSHPLE